MEFKKLLLIFCFLNTITLLIFSIQYKYLLVHLLDLPVPTNHTVRYSITINSKSVASKGDNWILDCLTKGKWLTRNMTEQEEITIDTYLRKSREEFHIPSTFQRVDGRCGDVPYEQSPLYNHMWFRSICNPKGDIPCCEDNRCKSRSTEQCRCPTCIDERLEIHSEFSTWRPDDHKCAVQNFTSDQACSVLNGSTVYFIGDSFIRHVFVAMVILLTNDAEDGALKPDVLQGSRTKCTGMYQITGITCRDLLDESKSVCNNSVKINYLQVFPSRELPKVLPVLKLLRQVKNSLIVLGLGIHDDFHVKEVATRFLWPFLNLRQHLSTSVDQDVDLNEAITNYTWPAVWSGECCNNTPGRAEYFIPRDAERIFQDLGFRFEKSASPMSNSLAINELGLTFKGDNRSSDSRVSAFQTMLQRMFKNYTRLSGTEKIQDKNTTEQSMYPIYPPNANINISSIHKYVEKSLIFQTFPKNNINNDLLWPRLLWVGAHAPGLLKSPKFQRQTAAGVEHFNKEIQRILKRWSIPYLDTFSFTKGTVSHDGTHYGWGINMLKVNMILHYIQTKVFH